MRKIISLCINKIMTIISSIQFYKKHIFINILRYAMISILIVY